MSHAGTSRAGPNRNPLSLDLLSVGIVVLAFASALIHFLLGLSIGPPGLGPFPLLFYLNAFGYLVLMVALYAPPLFRVRRVIRWVLIAYAALTIVLWFVVAPPVTPMGILDKVIEGALIALLVIDDRRAGPERAGVQPQASHGF